MARQKMLCLDIGAKIIGVAVSDAFGMAFPREEIRWGGDKSQLHAALRQFEAQEGVPSLVILGRPQNASSSMQAAQEIVEGIFEVLGWPVVHYDEHVSTQEAANRIADIEEETGTRFGGRRDSVAAQIILERYLAQS